jgi:hypothetical protein
LDIEVGMETLQHARPTPSFRDISHLGPGLADKRSSERQDVSLPARLTWKDQRGATRFASVVTRDVSDIGVYVECLSPFSIPLFRLVQFQFERESRDGDRLPASLRQQGRLLSAVYRVVPATRSGSRQGLALRLMVDPRRRAVSPRQEQATA